MLAAINEPISVVAIYDRVRNDVTPWRIKWQNRIYTISQIGYHHTVREGRSLLHIFSVTDGNTAFRLKHDTETLGWTLEEISDGLAD